MCHASTTDILDNLDAFHAAYYGADTFGGPSFYFHLRALDSRNCCDAFAEASYAMLVSWGMHRMGPRGAKMKDFDPYRASLNRVWPKIQQAAQFSPSEMDETEWLNLKDIFLSIDVMASGKLLVGNSKVMAHALPHIVPPIDGSYTLKYLCGKKDIPDEKERQWDCLKELVTTFFYPVVSAESFKRKCDEWKSGDFRWDTSPLKIVDNLLIGAVKTQNRGE